MPPSVDQFIKTVVVIGAGFAGCFTALELLKRGYKVTLVEKDSTILGPSSSSYNECYKLHTGLHYLGDHETAKQCLLGSLEFASEFPDFIQGNPNDPWRHGRHYIVSNTLHQPELLAKELRALYTEKVQSGDSPAVFGDPENFIRYLNPQDYPYVAKSISYVQEDGSTEEVSVKTAIETPESQINIDKLREHLWGQLNSYSSFTFLPNTEVKNLSFKQNSLDYQILAACRGIKSESLILDAASVVNCSWNKIEELNKQLGYIPKPYKEIKISNKTKIVKIERIIRVKISLLVELPDSLKLANTCIFSSGPHCSFTNLGDGTAIVTYEPVTNVGSYKAGISILDPEFQVLYKEKLVPISGKGKEFSEKIIDGASHYLPALKDPACKVKEVRLGHVKIFVEEGENYSLTDPKSAIHRRQENGVQQDGLCFLSHAGMKMTYTKRGAEEVADILDGHFSARQTLLTRSTKPFRAISNKLKDFPLSFEYILFNIFRNFLIDTTRMITDISAGKDNIRFGSVSAVNDFTKESILTEITNKFEIIRIIKQLSLNKIKTSEESATIEKTPCLQPTTIDKAFCLKPSKNNFSDKIRIS